MKKNIRRLIVVITVLAMVFGITGCGAAKEAEVQAEATEEYVYHADYKELSRGNKTYISPRILTDDGFYATSYEVLEDKTPEGVVPEYENQYAVWGSKLYFIGFDGTKQELTGYVPLHIESENSEKTDYQYYSDLSGIAMADDGRLISVESFSESWYDGPEGLTTADEEYYTYVSTSSSYYIRSFDESGKELTCAEISVPEDSYFYPYSIVVDENDITFFPGDYCLMAVDLKGETVRKLESETYVNSIVRLADGSLGATVYTDKGERMIVYEKGTYAEKETIDLPAGAFDPKAGSGEYFLYFNDGSNMYVWKNDGSEPEKLFNWLNCDINGGNVAAYQVNEDGSVTAIINTYDLQEESYTLEYATISKVLASTLPKKEIVTLATMGVDWDVRDLIIRFNRRSETCRIEIRDYSEYNTEDDYTLGATKLTTELLAGNTPDILDLNGLPYNQLASKGILEDLYPYIDADTEFSREDFFENVFKALEVDGKLCSTCASFSISALVGAASVVGDRPGWTYDDYYAALASMPEGCDGLDISTTRYDILRACLSLDMNEYMDWTTGKCSFDSEGFKKLIEFTASFPESFDWENYVWSEESNLDTRIAEGRQMLTVAGLYSISDIRYLDLYFGGDATLIGYPTMTGTGNMITTDSGYAICAGSGNKDLAWSFLRQFFTEKSQSGIWGLPTNRAAFNKILEKEKEVEYQKDEYGNYILDGDGNWVVASKGSFGASNGKVYNFYALTDEQAAEIMEIIESTTKVSDYNEKIYSIVEKHAKAYYAGDKSIDDTVRLIQSEANIYINEQR